MAKSKTVVTVISKVQERPVGGDAALVVIYGFDLGRKFDLSRETTVIGRSSKADIQIDQESISRNHAKLVSGAGHVVIQDLGSTNGTYINDLLIQGESTLRNGDLVKIGRAIFKFIAGGNIEAAYHDEIYRLTTVDGLTQIFNRRYFEEAIEREISRCHRYQREMALVMMDIDRFKLINDRFGHLAGDHVLKNVASTVRSRIRREDVLARYGGEEFALVLPECDLDRACQMAEKVRALIEQERFVFDRQSIQVTISVGVAMLGPETVDSTRLVRASDAKLYEAKESGRNCVRG